MEYKLQPLRISAGWFIEKNDFRECDPDDFDDYGLYFTEDIMQLVNRRFNLCIDLGWYLSNENGTFRLYMIKDNDWEKPLEVFESRDRFEVVEQIENWTEYDYFYQYLYGENHGKNDDIVKPVT
jgi:hypothetical protein